MQSNRLKRLFDVLALLAERAPLTVSEISTALSLPISSTHDLLQSMVEINMVTTSRRGYDLGAATARLFFKIQHRLDIVNASSFELQKLVRATGFDVYLAVQAGNEVIYVARFRGRQAVNIDIPLGLPLYRHATSVGKLFAAYNREILQEVMSEPLPKLTRFTRTDPTRLHAELARIRSTGISVSREEAVQGIVGLASPIMIGNEIVGAVHISAWKGALDNARLRELSAELQNTATTIGSRIGHGIPDRADLSGSVEKLGRGTEHGLVPATKVSQIRS
jgi:DNA-binding IclR family transcriptional regulator